MLNPNQLINELNLFSFLFLPLDTIGCNSIKKYRFRAYLPAVWHFNWRNWNAVVIEIYGRNENIVQLKW